MAGQLLNPEVNSDKQALANVLQFLKNQNFKETEEALKRELGYSPSSLGTTSAGVLQSNHTQPEQVEESYKKTESYKLPVDQRSISLSVPEDETITVDDETDDEDEEGPHSWPGTVNHLPNNLSQSFLKSITSPPVMSAQSRVPFAPPKPTSLVYKSAATSTTPFPLPTLFTVVPPGYPGPIGNIIRQSQPTSMPQMINISPMVTQVHPITKTISSVSAQTPSSSIQPKPLQQQKNMTNTTTLASIPPEEMTPAYIELKVFADEFKTKRIQLGYTQGAVGQSLADRGYSNFAQSTISRFEQLQLSPSNAAAIKIVLERWLKETENPESVPSSSNDSLNPRKRKKRAVFSVQTRTTLEEYFQKEPRPNRQIIEMIAHDLDLLPEEVRVWFCNKRQKFKTLQDQDDLPCEEMSYTPSSPSSSIISNPTSPPSRTKFTIEELSKSSSTGTQHTISPMAFTSQLTITPRAIQPIVLTSGQTITMTSPFINSFMDTKA